MLEFNDRKIASMVSFGEAIQSKWTPAFSVVITRTLTYSPVYSKNHLYDLGKFTKLIDSAGEAVSLFQAWRKPGLVKGLASAFTEPHPNEGINQWKDKEYQAIQKMGREVVVSLTGSREDCLETARIIKDLSNVVAIEYCPLEFDTPHIIRNCQDLKALSGRPILLRLKYDQAYEKIANEMKKEVAAVSLDDEMSWRTIFPQKEPPLPMGVKVGAKISGPITQQFLWTMAKNLKECGHLSIGIVSDTLDVHRLIYILEYCAAVKLMPRTISFKSLKFGRWT